VADGVYIDLKYCNQFISEDIDLNKMVA
jgi:CCR4-NOT transcription complex subunit 1